MSLTPREAEDFFARYARDLVGRNATTISRNWDVPCLVVGERTIPVADIKQVEEFFASSMSQYAGIERAEPGVRVAEAGLDNVMFCSVEWTHRDSSGAAVGSERGGYLIRKRGGTIKIVAYVAGPARKT